MANFNRAEARKASNETGKNLRQGGGNFLNPSKLEEGRYVWRIMPPHPTKNPDCLVFRPLHFIGGGDPFACSRWAPDLVIAKLGYTPAADGRPGCLGCDVVTYYSELKETNPVGYDMELADMAKKKMVEGLRPSTALHAYVLIIDENGRQHVPPKPAHLQASQTTIIEVLDDQGLGTSPVAAEALTNPRSGRNFMCEKSGKNKYKCSWDVFGSDVGQYGINDQVWTALMSAQYPNLAETDIDKYKTLEQQEAVLRACGLIVD